MSNPDDDLQQAIALLRRAIDHNELHLCKYCPDGRYVGCETVHCSWYKLRSEIETFLARCQSKPKT